MSYSIGIDMGINNVGWSILDNEKEKIEKGGTWLFSTSNSAADRRSFRNTKRRLKRMDRRIDDTLLELSNIGFPSKNTIDPKLIEKRYYGISKKIEKQDITNILCYMVSHRGYIPFGDEEVTFVDLEGKLPCQYYYELFEKNGKYRAMEQVVKNSDNIREIKALLETQSTYYQEISSKFIEKIVEIFVRKRKFYEGPGSINQLTPFGRFKTQEDVEEYLHHKELNPNYEKYIFEDLIGKCKICIGERCACKCNFNVEKYNLLNDFINISFFKIEDIHNQDCFYLDEKSSLYKLNRKGLESVINYCMDHPNLKINFLFKDLFHTDKDNIEGARKDKNGNNLFSTLNAYRLSKQTFIDAGVETKILDDIDIYNKIMNQFTVSPGKVEAIRMINSNVDYPFSKEELSVLTELYTKLKNKADIGEEKGTALSYHSLSEKIILRANEDMLREQMNFMQVRRKYDYDKEAREYFSTNYSTRFNKIPVMNSRFIDDIIASPQVKKSLRQAIKIINAIILEKKELPTAIVVESTKDMNGKDRKKEIEARQRKEEKLRTDAKKLLETIAPQNITENNILRVTLFNEMNGMCPYCNKPMDINDILNPNYQIEHILPYSKNPDDSFANKTLSCRKCNAEKKEKTPLQYLNSAMHEEYRKRILSNNNISDDKKNNLLFEGDLDKYKIRFFHRNLCDTAYASKEMINQIHLLNYYLELNTDKKKIETLSISGNLTHTLREKHNLIKDRDAGKQHHAVDASLIVSILNTDFGKKLLESQNSKEFWKDKNKDKKIEAISNLSKFITADKCISEIKRIDAEDKDIYKVAMQVEKNPQGSLANANIYKYLNKGDTYYKIEQIDNIYTYNFSDNKKKESFESLLDANDSKRTLLCYDNDRVTYKKIHDIYYKYKDQKGNPFVTYCMERDGIIDPSEFDYNKNGIKTSDKQGSPILKRLRYYSNTSNPYFLEKESIKTKENTLIGFDALSQVCTRVYIDTDKNQFIFLPIYAISINLTTREVKENDKYYQKLYELYIGNRNVKHIVDLYNGNYIEVKKKNGTIIEGNYQYFHKTNNKICLKNGTYFTPLDVGLTVYDYDVLGNRKKRLTCILK